jgi:Domain of unknown function (DUF5018)
LNRGLRPGLQSFLNFAKIMKVKRLLKTVLVTGLLSYCFMACNKEDDFNEGPFQSKRTAILSFSFKALPTPVIGSINSKDATIILTVPFATNRTNLVPTIEVSPKATVAPLSGLANNFTTGASYIVTSENGTTQTWRVTVNEAPEEAQPKLSLSTPVWNLSPSGTGKPSFFQTDGERGLDFGNNHLYITNNNDKILILSPADGSQIGALNMTGVDEGSPKISDVEVSDDGSILACNTVEWTDAGVGPPTTFKIYRWNNESSTPTVLLTYTNTQYRMGDSFTVIGNVTTNAVIFTCFGRKFLSPESRGNTIFRWNVVNGVVDTQPQLIQVQGLPLLSKFGSRPHASMLAANSTEIYSNANDIDFTLSQPDGAFISRIPNGSRQLYDGFNSHFEIFQFAGKTVLAAAFPRSNIESRLLVIDITKGLGNVTKENVVLSQNFMQGSGEIANINASGAVAINKLDANTVEIYCLITNQALAKFTLTTKL